MRILVDLNHPAHVHLFKHAIQEWQTRGEKVLITARDKEVVLQLLDSLGFGYRLTTKMGQGWLGFAREAITLDIKVLMAAREFDPDFLIGTSFAISHVSKLVRGRSIVFAEDDVGSSRVFWSATRPFADCIVTPDTILDNLGRKHIRYAGCQELAYLHPSRFRPNSSVLREQGLSEDEAFSIIRFVSLRAIHDIGQRGIRIELARQLVKVLGEKGRVIISSEGALPSEFESLKLRVNPEKFHDLLAYAHIFVSDSQSMTIEAAVLGVPSVRINSFVGRTPVIEELEDSYGLTFGFRPEAELEAIKKVRELLTDQYTKKLWKKRRKKLLQEKLDLTPWMINLVDRLHQDKHL